MLLLAQLLKRHVQCHHYSSPSREGRAIFNNKLITHKHFSFFVSLSIEYDDIAVLVSSVYCILKFEHALAANLDFLQPGNVRLKRCRRDDSLMPRCTWRRIPDGRQE